MALVGEVQGPVGVCNKSDSARGKGCIREGCLEEVPSGMKLPVKSLLGSSHTLRAQSVHSKCAEAGEGLAPCLGAIRQERGWGRVFLSLGYIQPSWPSPLTTPQESLPLQTLPSLTHSNPPLPPTSLAAVLCD